VGPFFLCIIIWRKYQAGTRNLTLGLFCATVKRAISGEVFFQQQKTSLVLRNLGKNVEFPLYSIASPFVLLMAATLKFK
jgi:hypothetical protein